MSANPNESTGTSTRNKSQDLQHEENDEEEDDDDDEEDNDLPHGRVFVSASRGRR
jgi:hypothetical protein